MDIILYALIFGLGYVVLQYIKQFMGNRQCPTDRAIVLFREGKLKEGQRDYEHIIGHLGICEKCQKRMSDF